jgi:hypothetical protein
MAIVVLVIWIEREYVIVAVQMWLEASVACDSPLLLL